MSELMSRVLYLKDGEEMLNDPAPYKEAEEQAQNLERMGYQVLAIMDADKAEAYRRRTDALDEGVTFPIEEYKTIHRNVLAEVADSMEPEDQDVCMTAAKAPETLAYERHHRRCTAMDFALRMYQNVDDSRSSAEVVDDAQVILNFLEG
jgi:hypothetical protein